MHGWIKHTILRHIWGVIIRMIELADDPDWHAPDKVWSLNPDVEEEPLASGFEILFGKP